MNTYDKFKVFCSNILIKDNVICDISYRYKRITRQLNEDFWESNSDTYHSLYVGSYGRDTDIHVSDIDMIFWLPYKIYTRYKLHIGNSQSQLLQTVKKSIQKTYSSSYLKADGQVIKVDFADGVSFEIVPCFLNVNGDGSFIYPDTNNGGSWEKTDPKPEIEVIKNANQQWNYNLKRLCRMARAWKDKWNVPIGGLLIDTLAYNFLSNFTYKEESFLYYDWMTRDFFNYLKNQRENQKHWHAPGSNQFVWKKGEFRYKALCCYNLAQEAIKYESKECHWSANQKWKEIYGPKFPD